MTNNKAKSTIIVSAKQASEHICLLKPVGMSDKHQAFITLAYLRAKDHDFHSREKHPLVLKELEEPLTSICTLF